MIRPSATSIILAFALSACAFAQQRIEETDPMFTYNGTWASVTDPNSSGGTYNGSSTVGSTVTFNVTGPSFVIYRKLDSSGGYGELSVDGNFWGVISFYNPTTVWQIPAVVDELPAGQHTIVLKVSSTPYAGSLGGNVYFDAFQNPAPAAMNPTQSQLDAITRVNFYRSIMGLPPVRHALALGLAAQAHAQYLNDVDFIANGTSPHVETAGASKFFTAAQPGDRDRYFGFTSQAGFEDSNNVDDPSTFVDNWMDGVYHRSPFLRYDLTNAGYGGIGNGSTMDFGVSQATPATVTAPTIFTYPADKQTNVWMTYGGGDGPNNITGGTYGYPISLWVVYPPNAPFGPGTGSPTAGSLTDSNGNKIPVTIADQGQDNQVMGCLMIPSQPLQPATTYTVHFTGIDLQSNPFDHTWSFTTGGLNFVHSPRIARGNNSYLTSINWDMPGTSVPSQLQYGPTNAYGTTVQGNLMFGNTYTAVVPGILTVPVTHYRITATDAQGNVFTTPDHTITVANPIAATTIGGINISPNQADTSVQFQTAGAVASVQFNYGTTTSYGSTMQTQLFGGYTTWYYGDINNLASGTYHYQITATDAQGNTFSTPDATFIVQ